MRLPVAITFYLPTDGRVRVLAWRCPGCGEKNTWEQIADPFEPFCSCGQQVEIMPSGKEPEPLKPIPLFLTHEKRRRDE